MGMKLSPWPRRAAAAGVALFLAAGPAAPAAAQSLVDALASAYSTNPTIRAAQAELRSVNEQVPQALSGWRPTVTVTGSAGVENREQKATVGGVSQTINEDLNPAQAQLEVRQNIWRGGRTVADTDRAKATVQAQRATYLGTEQDVLLRAATAYMNVWRDQSILQLNINNERVLEEELQASQARFEVGEITRTDVSQSEARLALARANREQAEGNLNTSRAAYQELIGQPPVNIAPPPALRGLPGAEQAAVDQARRENPNVIAAVYLHRAAEHQVRNVVGELLPQVSVAGRLTASDEIAGENTSQESAAVLAEVSVPLYQAGAVSSRVRQAKQVRGQRRLELDQAQRSAEQQAISAWEALKAAEAQIRSFESQVRANTIALEGVRQEYSVGVRTTLDVLDAEQELFDSQVSLVGAQRDEIVAGFQLLTAVGRMTAYELGLPVDLYDMQADYEAVDDAWFGLSAPGTE
jgi:TolC family type I secretion outer membrane protein